MSAQHGRPISQITEATNRATGSFWCSSGQHYAPGEPVMRSGGRRMCAACSAKRRAHMRKLKVVARASSEPSMKGLPEKGRAP